MLDNVQCTFLTVQREVGELTKRNLSKSKREDERARHSPLTKLIAKITEISGDNKYEERSGKIHQPPPTSSNSLISLSRLLLLLSVLLRTRVEIGFVPLSDPGRISRGSDPRMLGILRPIRPPAGEQSSSEMPAHAGAILNNGAGGEQNLPLSSNMTTDEL